MQAQGRGLQPFTQRVPQLRVSGKGGKTRYLPLHPGTHALIRDYLAAAGHDADALFRPLKNNTTGRLDQAIPPDGIYKLVERWRCPVCEVPRGDVEHPKVGSPGSCAGRGRGHQPGSVVGRLARGTSTARRDGSRTDANGSMSPAERQRRTAKRREQPPEADEDQPVGPSRKRIRCGTARRRTISCWRRKRISASRPARDLHRDQSNAPRSLSIFSIRPNLPYMPANASLDRTFGMYRGWRVASQCPLALARPRSSRPSTRRST